MLTLALSGCSLPAFLAPSESLYEKYQNEMRSLDAYGYSLEIVKSVSAEAYAALGEVRIGDAVVDSKETLIVTGTYNREAKTFTANVSINGERGGQDISSSEHTQIIVSGTNIYIDAESMYNTYANILDINEDYPGGERYMVLNGAGIVDALWDENFIAENAALAFVDTFESVMQDYLLEKGSFDKQKNYAGVILEDVAPQDLSQNLLQVAYTYKSELGGVATALLEQIYSDELQSEISEKASEAHSAVKAGNADAELIMNPVIMSATLLEKTNEYCGMNDENYAALGIELVDNVTDCKLVQRYTSDIEVTETGYSQTVSYLLGNIYATSSAASMMNLNISFVMDTTADTTTNIPGSSMSASAVMDDIMPVFMALITGETDESEEPSNVEIYENEEEDPESVDDEPEADPEDESEADPEEEEESGPQIEATLNGNGVPEEGTVLPEPTLSSDKQNFSAAVIDESMFFGLTSSFNSRSGVKVKDGTDSVTNSGGTNETITVIETYDNDLASGSRMKHSFYEYTAGTAADYYGNETVALQILCQPENGDIVISETIKKSGDWNYCYSYTESTATYHFYCARLLNDNTVEQIHGESVDVEVINELSTFVIPNVTDCEEYTQDDEATGTDPNANPVGTSSGSSSGTTSGSSSGATSSGSGSGTSYGSSSSSGTTTTTTVAATSPEYGTTSYGSETVWQISNAPSEASFGNTYSQNGYSTTEYTSYATVNRIFVYMNDQFITYTSNDLDDIYRNDNDMYDTLIEWPLSILLDEADSNEKISDLETAGDYKYRTVSFTDDGITRSIMIAVKEVDDNTVETLYLEVEGGMAYIEKLVEKLKG